MLNVFLMYALFGSIFSVGKVAMLSASPYFFTGTRMLTAGILVLGYLAYRDPRSLHIPKAYLPLLCLVAFFNVFITNAFEFWGLQYMSAGKTCLIYSLSPFAAAVIGYWFATESMTRKKWFGLGIGFLSFCPMMLAPWFESSGSSNAYELQAEAALVVSAVTAVIGWSFVKNLTIDKGISYTAVNGISFLLAGLMSFAVSFVIETWDPVPVTHWGDFFWTLLYIVIIHNLICYSIYASALRRYSVTFLAFAGLSNPLFAGLFGRFFLNEEITVTFIIALSGVVAGLYLFHTSEKGYEVAGKQVV